MAYDPKSFLTRALKEGFQPQYAGPQTSEDTNLTYLGHLATIDGVEVRPMTIGGTEETPEFGHIVSAPLTGKYEGYYRNDIFDDKGNFLRTTISEPGTSGLTDVAKFALNAATFGGFGPAVTAAARGLSALQAKNAPALLSALSGIPGAPALPSAVSDVLKYAGQAKDLSKALEGDPGAIFRTIVGASKSGALPKGVIGDIDMSGGGADPGYFDPEAETSPLPDWALDPYKQETKPGEYYAGLDKIVDEWDEADIIPDTYDTGPRTSMSPNEMAQFLEANIEDPGTIDMLMQDYFPQLYAQRIETTAKREDTGTLPNKNVIIPDWDFMEEPDRTPGSPTDTTPQPPKPDDDRTVAPGPAPTPPAKPPTQPPSRPAAPGGDPYKQLLALFAAPQRAPEEPYRVAQTVASPFGTIYDTYGGNDMQDLLGFLRRG